MRRTLYAALFGSSLLAAVPVLGQGAGAPPGSAGSAGASGPANLCQELLAYAEKKAAAPPKEPGDQGKASAAAPLPRADAPHSGTQGGGSVGPSSSADTSSQATTPPTTPVAPGAQSEPASSPYATGSSSAGTGATPPGAASSPSDFKLAGGVSLQQIRDTAGRGERQACRATAQELRRAGADLPAELIALSAYEPDPAQR